jgi:putative transposase
MIYEPQNAPSGHVNHRRSIRLKGYDYAQAGAYFVTIVAQGREPFFGKIIDGEMIRNDAGQMVNTIWEALPERFPNIELGANVVMPNHFHAILIINESVVAGAGTSPALHNEAREGINPSPTLGQIIGAFKSITTHEYIQGVDELGWEGFYKRLWQRNYYEHIIRSADEANLIHLYIEANPAQWEYDNENPACEGAGLVPT